MKGINQMEIKDVFRQKLDGEKLNNALGFIDYLTAKGLIPNFEWENGVRFIKNDKSPCLVFVIPESNEWVICDLPVASESEWNSLNNELKNLINQNIKICTVHEGGSCGCGSEPGLTKEIFGKVYNNVCSSEIQFVNPGTDVLDKLKNIINWWTINVI
jgi:hypothetical protein